MHIGTPVFSVCYTRDSESSRSEELQRTRVNTSKTLNVYACRPAMCMGYPHWGHRGHHSHRSQWSQRSYCPYCTAPIPPHPAGHRERLERRCGAGDFGGIHIGRSAGSFLTVTQASLRVWRWS